MNKKNKGASYGQSCLSIIDRVTSYLRVKKVVKVLESISGFESRNLNVIELGCGYDGKILQALAKRFPGFIFKGIDRQVNQQGLHPGLTLTCGDIENWQSGKQFDIVLSLAVIEHLVDPLQHLQKIHQLLKPAGVAILTSPVPASHFFWSILKSLHLIDDSLGNDHVIYLTKSGFVQLSQRAGLRIEKLNNFEFGINRIVVFKREEEERINFNEI